MTPNRQAFLDMIAVSEIGEVMLGMTDNGYDVLVGSTPDNLLLFQDYSAHPHIYNKRYNSTAAGRYQELWGNWVHYAPLLKLKDFGHDAQDAMALRQLEEAGALPFIDAGNLTVAVARAAHLWASLPGAGYAQRENKLTDLAAAYTRAGGTLA